MRQKRMLILINTELQFCKVMLAKKRYEKYYEVC
jgi:hypothetical protein